MKQGKKQVHNPQTSEESTIVFRDLPGRILWEIVLERRGAWESWLIFRDYLLQTQAWSVLARRQSSRGGRRPAGMNKMFLTRLKHEKETYKRWKQGQVTQEE